MNLNQAFIIVLSQFGRILHRLWYKRPFTPPQKAIIIQPGTIADVMMSTPMLARLRRTYPQTRFDWAGVYDSYQAIVGNEDIVHHIHIPLRRQSKKIHESEFLRLLKEGKYDTCFLPDDNPRMLELAIQAEIPQRIGLWNEGRGYRFTVPIQTQSAERHRAANNLALAKIESQSLQLSRAPMEFFPSDSARKSISERLIDELDWVGEQSLVIINPGAGDEADKVRWPIERYVLLGNRIIRHHKAKILLVGLASDLTTNRDVAGMIAGDVANWAGKLKLSEIGALAELADLYIGNDGGITHIAAAMGCPTIALFGPTDPSETAPYGSEEEQVHVLWKQSEEKRPFDWQDGITVAEVEKAVNRYLQK